MLFSNCDNIKNEKRTELYYSQNEIRLTNLDTGEVYSTKIRQEYDFMYWVNPIREAFAENDYIKAVEKLIDTYMEQNAYLYQSRVKNSIMILLRQYVNSEREK